MKKTALVTGASSGMGKATAIRLAQNGYTVYGAARRIEKMQDLIAYGIKPILMDLADEKSIQNLVNQIYQEKGRIDILVNNAGFGLNGAMEDLSLEDVRNQFEVNVFGPMRLVQLVLPKMRENSYGKIINITSIAGKLVLPLMGWYSASKFALEAASDGLRMELKPFGIDVIVIEPGGIKSEWSEIAYDNMLRISGNTAYKNMALAAKKSTEGLNLPGPEIISELVQKSIETKKPKARYSGGYNAKSLLFMAKYLPDNLKDNLLMKQING